jgi:hypothetical protein
MVEGGAVYSDTPGAEDHELYLKTYAISLIQEKLLTMTTAELLRTLGLLEAAGY